MGTCRVPGCDKPMWFDSSGTFGFCEEHQNERRKWQRFLDKPPEHPQQAHCSKCGKGFPVSYNPSGYSKYLCRSLFCDDCCSGFDIKQSQQQNLKKDLRVTYMCDVLDKFISLGATL